MHDGSLATIDDVLEHYSSNIKNTAGLDPSLKSGNQALKMNLTEDDKVALKAFLATMTDHQVIADVKFSDPFKK
jgi:cytochrome c peroxidase